MPKVKEGYFEEKRQLILDAAYAVYMRKPVYEVRMKDVIAEAGLSQGGVYRYFSNLDDILFALLNREKSDRITDQVDGLLTSEGQPEDIIREMFALMAQLVSRHIQGYGKIYFELAAVFANDLKRFETFRANVNLTSGLDYLHGKAFAYVQAKIEEGYFKPKLPVDDIFHLLIASMDGIERDLIFAKCYNFGDIVPVIKGMGAEKMYKALGVSLLLLLNGKHSSQLLSGEERK